MTDEYRIAKYIARTGYCSRREAEQLVFDKKVSVNGLLVENIALKVTTNDTIAINNKILPKITKRRLWIYHKKSGLITTSKDEKNRMTIFDDLPTQYKNLKTIGRLDKNTEGLLLLTNDGEYARELELPQNNYERSYNVRVFGQINQNQLDKLQNGITIDHIEYKSIIAKIIKTSGNNSWLNFKLYEGKNREIRNILSFFNLKVDRLIRIQYGPYLLGNIAKGEIIEVDLKC